MKKFLTKKITDTFRKHPKNQDGKDDVHLDRKNQLINTALSFEKSNYDNPAKEAKEICEADDNLQLLNKYNSFRNKYQSNTLPELQLLYPDYPYGECCIIVGEFQEEKLIDFSKEENLQLTTHNNTIILSTTPLQKDATGTRFFFSGVTRWRNEFIYGVNDIVKHNISVKDLCEEVGEFELLYIEDNKIELSTDFLGLCQWYYYKPHNNDVFIASTSYHMLLLVLKELGVKLKLNTKKIAAGIVSFTAIAQSSFTTEMDVADCFELPADQKVLINKEKGNVSFEHTSLFEIINSPEPYSEKQYEHYLYEAKEELIDNVRAVLQHPQFDYVLCDLTGGLDSKTVLGAILNLPRSLIDKVRIYTIPNNSEDYKIAASIVETFNLKWNDLPNEKATSRMTKIENNQILKAQQSYNLGTYYMSFYINAAVPFLPKTIRFTGGCGEVIFRDFYTWVDYSRSDDEIINQIGRSGIADISDTSNAGKNFTEYIRTSINQLPEKPMKGRLSLHYLYYRNRHHFKTKYNTQFAFSSPAWMPLQSKAAFRCKQMYFLAHEDAKLQYDLLYLLNPLLAKFPYDNPTHQKNLTSFEGRMYNRYSLSDGLMIDVNTLTNPPKVQTTFIPDEESINRLHNQNRRWYRDEDVLLTALKTFLDYSPEFEELGLPLFQYFTEDIDSKKYKFSHMPNMRINRILSAYWQIQLING